MAEIKVIEERVDNLMKTNTKEHGEMSAKLDSIAHKLDNLPNDFPTRIEFTTAHDTTKERIRNIENILKGAGGMVGVAILGSLLKLILK